MQRCTAHRLNWTCLHIRAILCDEGFRDLIPQQQPRMLRVDLPHRADAEASDSLLQRRFGSLAPNRCSLSLHNGGNSGHG